MINVEEWMDIQSMYRRGLSISEIARRVGRSRKTVRKYLSEPQKIPEYTRKIKRKSKLDPYKDFLLARMREGVFNGQKLFDEIKRQGYTGGITILRDWMKPFRDEEKQVAELRFETEPGRQAQADWASFGQIFHQGTWHPLSGFIMKLGYSRCHFLTFTISQDLEHLLESHVKAFEFFGGVPEEILYDNPKTVVIWRKGKEIKFHPRFIEFCAHYGFIPKPCWPGRAKTKGKVERGVGYVKGNFWPGISFESLEDLNEKALSWCRDIANKKISSETGEAPCERLKRENLKPINIVARYDTSYLAHLKTGKDCLVRYKGVWYSVPWQYARKRVLLRAPLDGKKIFIYQKMNLIAEHERCYIRYTKVINEEHVRGLIKKRRQRKEKENSIQFILPSGPGIGLERVAPEVEERPLIEYEKIAKMS
ncbi:IS21 family transposase [Candidatus Aerophobetes bacterium]|uniref:IS21 family transposase n=1 Tax=Aerophobetes bacterium TaxID=2030807 RepID=A0A662D7E4_UNCAE|nr:MAG: IS21 family transposase [Candidatus Aerophobetes bacterium]